MISRSAASIELDQLEQLLGPRSPPRRGSCRTAAPAGPAARGRSGAGRARPPAARRRSGGGPRRGRPPRRRRPRVARAGRDAVSVVSIRTVVDLPAPLGPRKPKISPGSTARSTPRTASTVPARPVKVLTRPWAETASGGSVEGAESVGGGVMQGTLTRPPDTLHPRFPRQGDHDAPSCRVTMAVWRERCSDQWGSGRYSGSTSGGVRVRGVSPSERTCSASSARRRHPEVAVAERLDDDLLERRCPRSAPGEERVVGEHEAARLVPQRLRTRAPTARAPSSGSRCRPR